MADRRMDLRIVSSDANVTLELWSETGPIGHIRFEAPEVSDLIERLSAARAQLRDQVPLELDPGSRVAHIIDPPWRTPPFLFPGGRPVMLRHPGLGWLGFLFPEEEARNLARQLTRTDLQAYGDLRHTLEKSSIEYRYHLTVSQHAETAIRERAIDQLWLWRAFCDPDVVEQDPSDPTVTLHFKAIEERQGRVLRLVFRRTPDGGHIITVFFDRRRRK